MLFAMDADNEAALRAMAPKDCAHKIRRLRAAAGDNPNDCDVPAPYEADGAAFEQVFRLLERCCRRVADGSG